jgi:hypothetical protein
MDGAVHAWKAVLTLKLADGSPSRLVDGHRRTCSVVVKERDGHRSRAR